MKKISIITFLLVSLNCFSQNLQVIDTVKILCSYDYSRISDTITGNTSEDLVYLQIGTNYSKSFSYYTFQCDSLNSTPHGRKKCKQMMYDAYNKGLKGKEFANAFPRRRMKTHVFKNYPEGELSVIDNILDTYYIYKDSMELQNWIIINDSTKAILGHDCQKATCNFRGRQWTAWFALDIPISDGPWKFRGLPGLIMEVYDWKYQEHFCINGLQDSNETPIYFGLYGKDVVFEKIERRAFQKVAYDFLRNSNSLTEAMSGISLGMQEKVIRRDLIEREEK